MLGRLREALGSGRPVEFASAWPVEDSITRIRALMRNSSSDPASPVVAGSIRNSEVVIRLAWKFLQNIRNTQFIGHFVKRGDSVFLVGAFGPPVWRKIQYAPAALLGAFWIIGATAYICRVVFFEPETIHARPVQPLVAMAGILFFAYMLSLLRLDEDGVRLMSAAIKKALGPSVT
jgi:hypothetical protein